MRPGRTNHLPVIATGAEGVVLGTREHFVMLRAGVAPEGVARGDTLDVFVTVDDDGRWHGSMERPVVEAGGFAVLEVVDVGPHGAFVDWGLPKDLLIPGNKQHIPLEIGDRPVVAVAVDHRGRCYGSTWLAQYLDFDPVEYQRGQQVSFLVYGTNEHGALGVVDGCHSGMIPRGAFSRRPYPGTLLEAWVERVRDDGRLDCGLRQAGPAGRRSDQDILLAAIRDADGRLDLTDRSSPDVIRARLGMSKKRFKSAVGGLYRKRLVTLHDDHIALA